MNKPAWMKSVHPNISDSVFEWMIDRIFKIYISANIYDSMNLSTNNSIKEALRSSDVRKLFWDNLCYVLELLSRKIYDKTIIEDTNITATDISQMLRNSSNAIYHDINMLPHGLSHHIFRIIETIFEVIYVIDQTLCQKSADDVMNFSGSIQGDCMIFDQRNEDGSLKVFYENRQPFRLSYYVNPIKLLLRQDDAIEKRKQYF